jgi:hypothetical protein
LEHCFVELSSDSEDDEQPEEPEEEASADEEEEEEEEEEEIEGKKPLATRVILEVTPLLDLLQKNT